MSRRRRPPARRRPLRPGDILLTLGLIGVLALSADRVQRLAGQRLSGAAQVHDGDTLTVRATRIRLEGIDAPEHDQTCSRGGKPYPCGREARDMLRRLAASGALACEGSEHDRYGRLLARCEVNGRDVGEALVAAGWAVANGDYDAVEAAARRARRGIWDGAFEAPRDWRARHGDAAGERMSGTDRPGLWARLVALLHGIVG